jgi:hypothetical protein
VSYKYYDIKGIKMFSIGKPVMGKDFIDRKKHLPIFKMNIDDNQSIMIKAPRRFGKTSLVKHLLENKKEYNFLYIDIRRFSNIKTLSEDIVNQAYKFSGIDNFIQNSKKSVIGLLKSLKSVSLDDIGEVTLEFQEENMDEVEFFLHALDIVEKIAIKKDITIQFALDEFQDILKIANKDILEKCRSVMQHHKNVTYIFLGSIESIMTEIFENKSSPFFHFTQVIELPPLDINELFVFSEKVFKKECIKVNSLKSYLEFLQGHPDYSIQFLRNVYINSIIEKQKELDNQFLFNNLIITIESNKAYIDELILKAKSRKHHMEQLTAIANNKILDIDSRTSLIIKGSLEDMGLIKRISRGKYILNDILLSLSLQEKDIEVGSISQTS